MSLHLFPRTLHVDVPAGVTLRASVWLWLTVPIAVLVAVISVIGVAVPNFYHDPPVWANQVVAQDFVDLVLVLPVLVMSAVLAARGSKRARLVWLGTLSYVIYTFVIYTFAVHHNPLFLAYVAVLGCSLWALIGGIATTNWGNLCSPSPIDSHAGIAQRRMETVSGGPSSLVVRPVNIPVKPVSIGLIVQAVLFYLLWLGDEIPAAITGSMPRSLQDTGLLTNPVHVLDMAILLPAIVVTGVWLWRKQALGYGLAAAILVNLVFQGLGIAAIMLFSIRAGLPGSRGMAGVFLTLSAGNLALLIWYMRGMNTVAL